MMPIAYSHGKHVLGKDSVGLQQTSETNYLSAMLQTTQAMAVGLPLDEVLSLILGQIVAMTESAMVRLVLARPSESLTFAAGIVDDRLAAADLPILQFGLEQETATTIKDFATINALAAFADEFDSIMVVPLSLLHPDQQAVIWLGFTAASHLANETITVVNVLALQAIVTLNHDYANLVAETQQEHHVALLANDVEPIIIVDKRYRIQVLNPAALSLFNVDNDVALGRSFESVVPNEQLIKMIKAGFDAPADVEFTAENGMTFSPHVSPVLSSNGDLRGWLLVLRDVTRFKNLSENMSNFLHTVSHDIRSPMTAAKGYVDMLRMIGDVNERQEQFITKILTSISDMTNLVEKVLDAGRLDPEMDVYEIRRETTDPSAIVQKVVSTLSNAAEQKKITLTYDVSPQVPIMNIDELMTERAMMNLVENAIKYTPEGGEVHVSARVEDNMLVMSVSDDGYGISAEDQQRLFERGERVRRKEHKGIRGSGLGLFIVRNVARKHGGFATVESEVGQGSTFSISIPLIGENLMGGGYGTSDNNS